MSFIQLEVHTEFSVRLPHLHILVKSLHSQCYCLLKFLIRAACLFHNRHLQGEKMRYKITQLHVKGILPPTLKTNEKKHKSVISRLKFEFLRSIRSKTLWTTVTLGNNFFHTRFLKLHYMYIDNSFIIQKSKMHSQYTLTVHRWISCWNILVSIYNLLCCYKTRFLQIFGSGTQHIPLGMGLI